MIAYYFGFGFTLGRKTGLLLITWSASFTYLEMSRLWRGGDPR